jgi:F0F1-type ATP synthase assembly protein I
MNLTVADWVQVIAFGALLGAAGQIVRVVAGLKKLNEVANEKRVAVAQLFSTSQFVFSVLIGAVAGLLGAVSLGINPKDMITTDKLLTLLGMGYAGADFIEAFMTKHGSVTGSTPNVSGTQTTLTTIGQGHEMKPKEEAAVG